MSQVTIEYQGITETIDEADAPKALRRLKAQARKAAKEQDEKRREATRNAEHALVCLARCISGRIGADDYGCFPGWSYCTMESESKYERDKFYRATSKPSDAEAWNNWYLCPETESGRASMPLSGHRVGAILANGAGYDVAALLIDRDDEKQRYWVTVGTFDNQVAIIDVPRIIARHIDKAFNR